MVVREPGVEQQLDLVLPQGKPLELEYAPQARILGYTHWVHILAYEDGRREGEARDAHGVAKVTYYDDEKVESPYMGLNNLDSLAQGSPRERRRTWNLHWLLWSCEFQPTHCLRESHCCARQSVVSAPGLNDQESHSRADPFNCPRGNE